MSTQRPHHVSNQESKNPGSLNVYQSLSRRAGNLSRQISQNEPNSRTPGVPPTQICKTNPICPHSHPVPCEKCKTNPIYPAPDPGQTPATPNMRNEPNLIHPRVSITRNEPNSRIPGVPPSPISAKRTQFTPTPAWPTIQKYETNPISAPRGIFDFLLSRGQQPAPPNLPRATIRRPKNYETNPIYRPALSFRLSTLYFLLSRGQRPAPRATKLHKSYCARRKDFCVSSHNRQACGQGGWCCNFYQEILTKA